MERKAQRTPTSVASSTSARAVDASAVTPASRALELQRAVGNRAASTVLAREPENGSTAKVPGIGEIPIESYQWTPGAPNGNGGDRPFKEIVITSKMGKHSTALQRAMLQGKVFDEVEISTPGHGGIPFVLRLKKAMISAWSVGGGGAGEPIETWQLSVEVIEGPHGSAGGGSSGSATTSGYPGP